VEQQNLENRLRFTQQMLVLGETDAGLGVYRLTLARPTATEVIDAMAAKVMDAVRQRPLEVSLARGEVAEQRQMLRASVANPSDASDASSSILVLSVPHPTGGWHVW
jgi:hypothetical protein